MDLRIMDQEWTLLPQKAVYWHAARTLILSDLHLAKDTHFRKHGFAVPPQMSERTLERLSELISQWKPQRLLILGDLFHSEANQGLEAFAAWRQSYSDIAMQLVVGNHDVLEPDRYERLGLTCMDALQEGPFLFRHDPEGEEAEGHLVCGHLHPAVRLSGSARQTLRFPCFWIGEKMTVLPAFGEFTGSRSIRYEKKDRVVAVAEGSLYLVNGQISSV